MGGGTRSHACAASPGVANVPRCTVLSSRFGHFTRIGHVPGGRGALLREGGPISYKARPSQCSCPVWASRTCPGAPSCPSSVSGYVSECECECECVCVREMGGHGPSSGAELGPPPPAVQGAGCRV